MQPKAKMNMTYYEIATTTSKMVYANCMPAGTASPKQLSSWWLFGGNER